MAISDKNERTEKNEKTEKSSNKVNEDLYKTIVLSEYIYLKPTDLNFKIDDIILNKLKRKIEGKCLKVGYIMPNTI